MERENQNRKDEQQGELNQHLNDTASVEVVSTDISAILSKATAYERAVGRIKDLIVKLHKERKGDLEDESFEIVSTYLHVALNHCVGECDRAWQKVYANPDFGYGNYEKLNNAVMLQAALDYEKDICSGNTSSKRDMEDIERFAESGDSHTYSDIDFTNVLKRIRDVAPEFQRIVRTKGAEIISDTLRLKRKKDYGFAEAKNRCPLCGGGLYHYGKPNGNVYRIKCSGCNMEGWYYAKESY